MPRKKNDPRIVKRNKLILERYKFLHDEKKLRRDYVLDILSNKEFFLDVKTLSRIVFLQAKKETDTE